MHVAYHEIQKKNAHFKNVKLDPSSHLKKITLALYLKNK
jgi:hypothetical protein